MVAPLDQGLKGDPPSSHEVLEDDPGDDVPPHPPRRQAHELQARSCRPSVLPELKTSIPQVKSKQLLRFEQTRVLVSKVLRYGAERDGRVVSRANAPEVIAQLQHQALLLQGLPIGVRVYWVPAALGVLPLQAKGRGFPALDVSRVLVREDQAVLGGGRRAPAVADAVLDFLSSPHSRL